MRCQLIPLARIVWTVVMKFSPDAIDEKPSTAAIAATGATAVASANPGCSVQIAHHLGARGVEVVHPIELLDRALAD